MGRNYDSCLFWEYVSHHGKWILLVEPTGKLNYYKIRMKMTSP